MDLSISSSLDLGEARDGAGAFDGERVKSGLSSVEAEKWIYLISSVEVVGVKDKRGSGEEGTGIGASLQSWPQ